MKYVIVGTAGHVDHGKTTLIQELTGVDTDRLSEEKKRGISIELGFAPFVLPSGRMAGVVDVPGHEKFIKHMLAGAGGMDLVMLVVAANEGVMPQTLEHLHILDLLNIEKGIIVITKKDLVDDDWMSLVEEDVRAAVAETFLKEAPIISVSAQSGAGLDLLKETMDALTEQVKGKDPGMGFRLPADRVFTMKGAGTVVTGTLVSGVITPGMAAEILPSQKEVRIRQIQVHGKKVEEAFAGQRVAVNLAGVEVDEMERGNVIAQPGLLHPTQALDIRLKLLEKPFSKESRKPLQNRSRIRFHTGTQEILGRIMLLENDRIEPGMEAYAQIFLEEAAVVGRGDHFIIRSYSPASTIGGGTVIEPYAKKHKRFRQEVIEQLMVKEQGTPRELVEQYLQHDPDTLHYREEITKDTGLSETAVQNVFEMLSQEHVIWIVHVDQRELVFHASVLQQYSEWIGEQLNRFHQQNPLRTGMLVEELRTKLFRSMTPRIFSLVLQHLAVGGVLVLEGFKVRKPDFSIQFGNDQEKIRKAYKAAWSRSLFAPPAVIEIAQETGRTVAEVEQVAEAMAEIGEAVSLASGEITFSIEAWDQAVRFVLEHFSIHDALTLAEFRDGLQTSRKYALALLEQMDERKITRRTGDKRMKGK